MSAAAAPPPHPGPRPRHCMLRAAPVLLALLLAGRGTAGGEEAPSHAARWEALRSAAITRLHEIATWCNGKRLYGSRASTYGLILAFDPDDAAARKRLRFRRGADGRWTRKARSSPPRNLGTGKKQYDADLAAWRTWLLAEVQPLLVAAQEAGDARLACAILRAAVPAAPDDALLREANGEVRHTWNGTTSWVLRESQIAKERRFVLERIGAEAPLEVPDPAFREPRPDERREGVAWGQVREGRHVRVLGTAAPPEMDEHYANAEAIPPVLAAVLDVEEATVLPVGETRPVTLYVTRSVEAGNRFLDALPDLVPGALERLRARPCLAVPERHAVLVKDASRTWRLEAGTHELVALALARRMDIGDDDAWLAEGLTHYVTRLITRTRQVFRTADGTAEGIATWLASPDASVHLAVTEDWLGAGHDLLTREPRPDLSKAASKDLRSLSPDELLLGYVLAAYLVEGHPEDGPALVRAVGRTPPSALETVVLEHLGYDLPTLQTRLVRWLAETTGRVDREE